MAFRIEIGLKRGVQDSRGVGAVAKVKSALRLPLRRCSTRDVYLVDSNLSPGRQREIRDAFADPVIARAAVGRLSPPPFDWLLEIGFKPGVTDNVGHTARTVLADVLDIPESEAPAVYSSTQFFLSGALSREEVLRIGRDLLANELIQTHRVYSPGEWNAAAIDTTAPAIHDATPPEVHMYRLDVPDDELLRISRDGILSLSLEEMHVIRGYYERLEIRTARVAAGLPVHPTDVELECVAQTWSEHCKHKIFAARVHYTDETGRSLWIDSLFKTFIQGSTERIARDTDLLISVFTDNAGIIRFNNRYHIAYKAETHNSPSALDPYGGAITGIVGVNRDPMGTGMGCELLCNTWGYCLASPFFDGDLPRGLMHPRRIRDGVHQGVMDGGNQSGIPWARGFERFDDRYLGKPLVYCGTIGRIPRDVTGGPSERKEILPGDRIVMCGGRIGKDGIHGATFSSEELRTESPAQAVQIGDPITQRKMYEFLVEARDLGLYRALTDNGAGGLSSSIGEMSTLSGGAEIDLARAPLKYSGLQPWEILLSEAQERMSLAVQPEQMDAFMTLARRREVEATDIGQFTDSGLLILRMGDRVVGRLDLEFLHKGCPRLVLEATWTPPQVAVPKSLRAGRRDRELLDLLSALNVCSREYKSRAYDGEVKGLSVVKPFVGVNSDVPSDATVLRVELESNEGIVLAEGINPFYSDLDTYSMMASVIDEAVRRVISVGGRIDHMAGLDNFCWPDPVESEKTPDGRYKMAQLVRANQALYDLTTAYRVPCISGKDSMKNDSTRGGRKISIPPTVLFSTIAKIDNVRSAVTMDFKRPGDAIYVAGWTKNEMGASEYHRLLAGRQGTPNAFGGTVPGVDPVAALALYRAMGAAHARGLLHSAHTPTLGGLAVAFALAALGGDLGAEIDLAEIPVPEEARVDDDARLFSESNSRFVVTCAPEHTTELESLFAGQPLRRVGIVTSQSSLQLHSGARIRVRRDLELLRRAFKRPLWNL